MQGYKKAAKATLIITYVFAALLIVLTFSLPYGITWYVETKGRSADLAAVVMLTCYPCVPFAAVALFCLQRFLKSMLSDSIFEGNGIKDLFRISVCCFFAGIIMIVAGIFYMPFYIAGGAALFGALITKAVYDLMLYYKKKDENEK